MTRKTKRFAVLIVAVSMLTVGFAFTLTASADEDFPENNPLDEKKDKKDASSAKSGEITYVNTDNGFVACLPDDVTITIPETVTVYDPLYQGWTDPKEDDPGDEIHSQNIPEVGGEEIGPIDLTDPKHGNGVCLGGAIFADTDPSGLWKMWAQEEVHHQLGGQSCAGASGDGEKKSEEGDKILCPSGFAQIRSSYVFENQDAGTPNPTCVPSDTWTKVCVNPDGPGQGSDTKEISWVTHKTAFCNDLKIDIDDSVIGEDDARDQFPDKTFGDHVETTHDVLLFFSGPDFVLDCFSSPVNNPLTGDDPIQEVKDLYAGSVVPWLNSVTCNGPTSEAPPGWSNVDPDDEPGEVPIPGLFPNGLPNLVCFLNPFGGTNCPDRVGTIATVGTVTYEFDGTDNGQFCNEDFNNDDARELSGTQPLVTVQNFPVVIE